MADWLDAQLGGLCKDLQKQIDDIPFMTSPQKAQYIQMLEECATNAQKENQDSVSYFKTHTKPILDKLQVQTGRRFNIA